jgi:hypothetical protein
MNPLNLMYAQLSQVSYAVVVFSVVIGPCIAHGMWQAMRRVR